MKDYCVYRHLFPNGKSYIGITNDTKRRWRNGNGYNGQDKIEKAIKKYGWENIEHIILYDGVSKETAETLEIESIEAYDSISNGYNISHGGDAFFTGLHHTEDTKLQISEKLKHYIKTPDHRKHISEHKAGVLHHAAKKVYQYTKDGSFIREWSYMNEASKTLSIKKESISACCLGKRPSAGGYVWRYEQG